MSISSSSASVAQAVKQLEVGQLFWIHYDERGRREKAMYVKTSNSGETRLVISGNGDLASRADTGFRLWVESAEAESLTDDESARVTALIALGRGDLI